MAYCNILQAYILVKRGVIWCWITLVCWIFSEMVDVLIFILLYDLSGWLPIFLSEVSVEILKFEKVVHSKLKNDFF